MEVALRLARRALGTAWPNPAVGCVLVRDGRIVGRGWTQPGGRPHAETEAIRRAGKAARGADAYVTLEPCSHIGKTPPCAEAVIDAGIARVVIAIEDPDPRVSGKGTAWLRSAGIEVVEGVCADEAAEINAGYLLRRTQGRPLFTLKLASSLDGRIATAAGDSRWITGAPARAVAHRLRADHDAVIVGINTALTDDSALTCRLPGLEARSPVRVVLDSTARLPTGAAMASTAADVPTWLLTTAAAPANRVAALEALGVRVMRVEANADGRPAPAAVAAAFGEEGITRVLIEGGGAVAGAFLAAKLVDRVAWFHAPRVVGADGVPAAAALGVETVEAAPGFVLTGTRAIAGDLLSTFRLGD